MTSAITENLEPSTLQDVSAPKISSLSPSRASDFKTCPLLYRFRAIDRIPEAPSKEAARGIVVHGVLERIFDFPAAERTLSTTVDLVQPEWTRVAQERPEFVELFASDHDGSELAEWLSSAKEMVAGYFTLEDPRRLEPAGREKLIEVQIDSGLTLRGYVDRLDIAPGGETRIVDYKTGTIPREAFEAKALFQMKFYALILWRTRGVIPRQLRLMYLADRDTLTYTAEESELRGFERSLGALWEAIRRAIDMRKFRPKQSRLCNWCDHKVRCPAFGGTPPPYPGEAPFTEDHTGGDATCTR